MYSPLHYFGKHTEEKKRNIRLNYNSLQLMRDAVIRIRVVLADTNRGFYWHKPMDYLQQISFEIIGMISMYLCYFVNHITVTKYCGWILPFLLLPVTTNVNRILQERFNVLIIVARVTLQLLATAPSWVLSCELPETPLPFNRSTILLAFRRRHYLS